MIGGGTSPQTNDTFSRTNATGMTKTFQTNKSAPILWTPQLVTSVGTKSSAILSNTNYKKVQIGNSKSVPGTTGDLIVWGDITYYGSLNNASDISLKENIQSFDEGDNLLKLNPVIFNYKHDDTKKQHYGFIAQELEHEFPELVKETDDNVKIINTIELIPILVNKIQKMQKEMLDLKNKNTFLEKELYDVNCMLLRKINSMERALDLKINAVAKKINKL
jgi:hypothetical protein